MAETLASQPLATVLRGEYDGGCFGAGGVEIFGGCGWWMMMGTLLGPEGTTESWRGGCPRVGCCFGARHSLGDIPVGRESGGLVFSVGCGLVVG
jgi:hypothetical protein